MLVRWFVLFGYLPAASVVRLVPSLVCCSALFACGLRAKLLAARLAGSFVGRFSCLSGGLAVCLRVCAVACLFVSRVLGLISFMLARWVGQAKAEKDKSAKQAEADKAKKVSTQSPPREYPRYPA